MRDQALLRNKAIHLTLVSYGITLEGANRKPVQPSGQIQLRDAFQGRTISWSPVADDGRAYIAENKGRAIPTPPVNKQTTEAMTWSSGVTLIYEKAFLDPDMLAVVLFHEHEHFAQFTTPGSTANMSFHEREAAAWQKTASAVSGFIADSTRAKNFKLRFDSLASTHKQTAEQERRIEKWTLGYKSPATGAQSALGPAEIEDARRTFGDISALIESEVVRARQEAKRQRALNDAARKLNNSLVSVSPAQAASPGFTPQASKATPAPKDKILWNYYFRLAELAREACEAPGNLADYAPLYQLGVPWDEIGLRSDEMALAKEYARQLSGCVGGVFMEIMAAVTENRSGDIGNQWLKNKAAAIKESQRSKSRSTPSGGSGPKEGSTPAYSGPSQSLPSWAPTAPSNW